MTGYVSRFCGEQGCPSPGIVADIVSLAESETRTNHRGAKEIDALRAQYGWPSTVAGCSKLGDAFT